MGRDKATLPLSGEALWLGRLAVLRDLKPAAIWISAREKPRWAPSGVEIILDTPPSRGPLSGIAAGLNRIQTSHLLALAVDLPRMTTEHLLKLAGMTDDGCGVIAKNNDHLEPLSAIYPREAAPIVQHALTLSDLSMQTFAKKLLEQGLLKEYKLAPEERDLYLNVNTPSDLPP